VVYDKNTFGCLTVREKLLETISKTDEDGLDLGFTEFYTVALPPTLEPNSGLIPMKFKYSSSHTIRGVDCEASLHFTEPPIEGICFCRQLRRNTVQRTGPSGSECKAIHILYCRGWE
jgi:hypothetical protein